MTAQNYSKIVILINKVRPWFDRAHTTKPRCLRAPCTHSAAKAILGFRSRSLRLRRGSVQEASTTASRTSAGILPRGLRAVSADRAQAPHCRIRKPPSGSCRDCGNCSCRCCGSPTAERSDASSQIRRSSSAPIAASPSLPFSRVLQFWSASFGERLTAAKSSGGAAGRSGSPGRRPRRLARALSGHARSHSRRL